MMNEESPKKYDRRQWLGRPIHERHRGLKKLFFTTKPVKKLLDHVKRNLAEADADNTAKGALVIAPSGCGKSTFIRYLKKIYPDIITPELTVRQVISFGIPKRPTPAEMGSALLKELGDPRWDKDNAERKFQRIHTLLVACQTKVVCIDNFHDIPARSGVVGVQALGDWVRDICDVPFSGILLAFGTEKALVVRESNDQLARRMMARLDLPQFSADRSGMTEFCDLLRQIDQALPMAESSGLDQVAFAPRLHLATAGNFDYLMKLIKKAMSRAVERQSEKLELIDFEIGFEDLHQVAAHAGNPFSPDHDGHSLTDEGQVFGHTHQESSNKKKRGE